MTEKYVHIYRKFEAYRLGSDEPIPLWLRNANLQFPIEGRDDGIIINNDASQLVKRGNWLVQNQDGTISHYKPIDFEKNFEKYVEPSHYQYALEKLKLGLRLTRRGWNFGDNVWIKLVRPQVDLDTIYNQVQDLVPQNNAELNDNDADTNNIEPHSFNKIIPCFVQKNCDDDLVVGWLPNAEDQLANDWYVVA